MRLLPNYKIVLCFCSTCTLRLPGSFVIFELNLYELFNFVFFMPIFSGWWVVMQKDCSFDEESSHGFDINKVIVI